jgi:hypothetical protein
VEKIFAVCTLDKGLITRICRELKKTKLPQNQRPNKKWTTELNRTFSEEEVHLLKNR